MSISEPGVPYFEKFGRDPQRTKPFKGAYETTAGQWRAFDISIDSPHEPWCLHFEWGPCSCGPLNGEVFVKNGLTTVPTGWWRRGKKDTGGKSAMAYDVTPAPPSRGCLGPTLIVVGTIAVAVSLVIIGYLL